MREIKFRAWSKESKIMLMNVQDMYDSLGTWHDNHGKEIDDHDLYGAFPVDCFGSFLEDEKIIVMQFTGLKDKNGKEIYEGDILQWSKSRITIKFKEGIFGFNDDSEQVGGFGFLTGVNLYSEVIGNIYENPGLLK